MDIEWVNHLQHSLVWTLNLPQEQRRQRQGSVGWSSHPHLDSYQPLDWERERERERRQYYDTNYYFKVLNKPNNGCAGWYQNAKFPKKDNISLELDNDHTVNWTHLSTNSTSACNKWHFSLGQNTLMRLLVDRRSLYKEWANCCNDYNKKKKTCKLVQCLILHKKIVT